MSASIRRIHRARDLIGATRYLEIGVWKGTTFLGVEVERKDAVDPSFRFDTKAHASEAVRFFPMTSDAFFTRLAAEEPATRYDLAFVDGLHVFGQALRDVCATLLLLQDPFLMLIDDTLPVDIYSAEPNQARAYALREAAGLKSRAWHGDVFKVVAFLHDYFPNLSYATLREGGNGQTLVWREARAAFAPRFRDPEAIARLTYADFTELGEVMRYATEEEAFAQAAAALARPG